MYLCVLYSSYKQLTDCVLETTCLTRWTFVFET